MTAIAASPILRPEREPRSRRFWLAVAASVVLHALIIGAWLLFGSGEADKVPPPATMDVTIADDVSLTASAPQSETPPAESQAPDLGAPADAAPPPAPEPVPEKTVAKPTPPKPQPEAAPPPKPAALAKPQPKKIAPPSPKPARPQALTRPAPSSALAKIVGKGTGQSGSKITPRGSSLGGIVSSLGTQKSPSKSPAPQGAKMSAQASMDIDRKIAQQIQPCAQRQSLSAPGVEKIRVIVALKFNRDGSLAAAPRIVRLEGVDDDNQRYADQVRQRALAAFQDGRCQPIRGLPPELYDVPNGWSSKNLGFRLPG